MLDGLRLTLGRIDGGVEGDPVGGLDSDIGELLGVILGCLDGASEGDIEGTSVTDVGEVLGLTLG